MEVKAEAARIDKVLISSQFINDSVAVSVISPDVASMKQKIPTIYLLNGFDGDESTWLKIVPDLPLFADKYKVRFVTPDGRNSWYWDSPKIVDSRYEAFFTIELHSYILTHYNAPNNRGFSAVLGFSMGGHGAFWLAMHHPDLFGAIGSISGGLDLRGFKTNWNLNKHLGVYKDNEKLWNDFTVISHIDKLIASNYRIKFDCGEQDFFYPVNLTFHRLLTQAGIVHEFSTRRGSHTSAYARDSFESYLKFFSIYFEESIY